MMTATRRRTVRRFAAALAAAAGLAAGAVAQFPTGYRHRSGADLYAHVCQGCHMPDARGAAGAGAYPSLAGNRKLQAGLYPVLVILRGQKAMPSFADLSDEQVAAVTNHIRTNYGNSFTDSVTAAQVKALRAQAVRQKVMTPG